VRAVYDKGGTAGGCVSCLYVYNQFQVEKEVGVIYFTAKPV
jgi:hypothetical protein